MRVVFDTNIFISALVIPDSQGQRAIQRFIDGMDELLISKPLIYEVVGVLQRKFNRDRDELAHVALFLADIGELVHPRSRVRMLADEPFNRILECSLAGGADSIVTGDRPLLNHRHDKQIPMGSPRTYLEMT